MLVPQIKGGPLLQKQLVHNATIAHLVPRWQNFGASQFELQVHPEHILSCPACHSSGSALDVVVARNVTAA